ncbi:hypothetical protein GCM10023195_70840 [Actinoallomurus liliacearum]|uniref:Uncharacterized protein n=1 Tax=Actinoallomurus liliacearum TaxID=1080073 RepID=A0ABP8TTB3_9ACTN
MDLGGAYSNSKGQLRALEALLRRLPDLDAPVKPSPDWRKPRRARSLARIGQRMNVNDTTIPHRLRERGARTRDPQAREQ